MMSYESKAPKGFWRELREYDRVLHAKQRPVEAPPLPPYTDARWQWSVPDLRTSQTFLENQEVRVLWSRTHTRFLGRTTSIGMVGLLERPLLIETEGTDWVSQSAQAYTYNMRSIGRNALVVNPKAPGRTEDLFAMPPELPDNNAYNTLLTIMHAGATTEDLQAF